ncbi:Microsomal glutathione S-transferase 1 [Stylophora pistillata]|uniref:Microsomal glutathione S-transferase 1 n=1 Tax=Stylophora pistillata TaxID=50429 RepID=A0A2B4SFN0_STYPI|nr:Microsomal glutathione S-transferase 1 [Stylophora pistillata]
MSFLTARHRIANKAFPSPEDYRRRPVPINADVERVRRAHLNDLENIPIFMITALLYMFSGMPVTWGIWCIRVFTAAMIFHTIVYLNAFSYPRADFNDNDNFDDDDDDYGDDDNDDDDNEYNFNDDDNDDDDNEYDFNDDDDADHDVQ